MKYIKLKNQKLIKYKNLNNKTELINNLFIKLIFFIYIGIINFSLIFFINNNNKFFENDTNSQFSIETKKTINFIFLNKLKFILKSDVFLIDELMSKHTTFKIGGPAKYFVRPKSINQIIEIIKLCNKYKIHYFILGNGSNLLVSDSGYNGVVIQIKEDNFSDLKVIKEDENKYSITVGGGMLMKTLSIEACLLSLTGLEDIVDIPGTIGAGIIMNASFRGKGLSEHLNKVKVITPEGKIKEIKKENLGFSHRESILKNKKYIVIEAEFNLIKGDQLLIQKIMTNNTKNRYKKQPMYFGSAGCFFIWDHNKYGSLYQKYKESNLVGYRIGNIMIYPYNISFIVNLGKGTAAQLMELIEKITKIINVKYNIEMKREVIIIGKFNKIEYN